MKDPGRIVILGAGPTGLGAAYKLQELGVDDFVVLEAKDHPGGLATSYVDPQGFTWDVGGHVQFSHYHYYDTVLDRAVSQGWLEHERESWVWIYDRWVPYPFQYNIHRLPPEERRRAFEGLVEAAARDDNGRPHHFRDWIERTFGDGIGEIFLYPYNFKVWGYPLELMGVDWMGERVAVPDVERVRRNIEENRDDVSWGPNNRFRFPRRGGTGAIWRGVARLLDEERLRLGSRVAAVDAKQRRVELEGGERIRYDHLISSLALDDLASHTSGVDTTAAAGLCYSSVHILGVGLRGPRPETLQRKCWMYFPESHSPYYRVTVFSNYSPENVPDGEGYWSLMAEVCESPHKPVDVASLERHTLRAMRRDGLIPGGCEVESFWHHREEHGYPTPFLGRDEVLQALRGALEPERIYSRGRFGAWKYEVSNQDHSFMQGVEVVERICGLGDEPTLERPGYVNSGVFLKPEGEPG